MLIGVAGAGWWGSNIIRTLHGFERVEGIRAFDADPAVADRFAGYAKCLFVRSYEALLADRAVEAVCIATPPRTHAELTRRALAAGKHVLIEKPPADSAAEVEELGRLAERSGLVYMMDALYLFLEPVIALKEMLDAVPRGDIRFVQAYRIGDELRREGAGIQRISRTMFASGTDVVEDLFFHDAALLQRFFGDIAFVSAEKQFLYHPALCDTARIRLRAGDIPIELLLSWSQTGRRRGMSVYLRDAIIEYDALKEQNQISRHTLSSNSREEHSIPQTPPLAAMLASFLDAVAGGGENRAGADFMHHIIHLWEHIKHA